MAEERLLHRGKWANVGREAVVSRYRNDAHSQSLFEEHPDGIFEFDLHGRFVAGNRALESLAGYSLTELVGTPFAPLVHPDDLACVTAEFEAATRGESRDYDMVAVRKDGSHLTVNVINVPIVVAGEVVGVYGIARDVTERNAAQMRLSRSESLLRIAGAAARVGGWAYELGSDELFWSEEVYRLAGLPTGQPPGFAEMLQQFTPGSRRPLLEAVEACASDGRPYDLEVEFTTFDGRETWVRCVGEAERDADGTIVRLQGAMQDVTGQRKARLAAERLAGRLTATMESITDALYTLDEQWRFSYVNGRAEQLLERPATSLLGRSIWEEYPDIVGTPLDDAYRRAVAEQTTVTVDRFFYEPLDLWVEVRAFPAPEGLTVYFRDIGGQRAAEVEREALLAAERHARQEAEQAQRLLAHKVAYDELTGLYSRNEVVARLAAASREGYSLLLIDLDGFKRVNDALGRSAGDELLMNVAFRLKDLVRDGDMLARVGADQFAVLVPGRDSVAAEHIADRILEALRSPLQAAGQRLYVTASVGIAQPDPGDGGEAALREAEVAVDRAKDAGRNTRSWYDPTLEGAVTERLAMAADLHDALRTDQLQLHYQPSFDLASGRPVGAEALARWQHPTRGMISPGLFIPVAEETGLIERLGDWSLQTALQTAKPWTTSDPTFTVWVNVAVHQLRRPGLAARIERQLAATGTDPHRLGIEITESAFAADATAVREELDAIARLGVQIAIDDFGTGYSSLSRLAHLPIDVLKIDRSFITALDTEPGVATVAAIISLAHAIDARVIAEGVETHQQLTALRVAGCDYVSGFLLARPEHPARLTTNSAAGRDLITMSDPSTTQTGPEASRTTPSPPTTPTSPTEAAGV